MVLQQSKSCTAVTTNETKAVTADTVTTASPPPLPPRIRGLGGQPACRVHEPTLDELQAHTFSDYVRHRVLSAASRFLPDSSSDDDDDDDNNNTTTTTTSMNSQGDDDNEESADRMVPRQEPDDRPHFTRRTIKAPQRWEPDDSDNEQRVKRAAATDEDNNSDIVENSDEQEEPEEEWTEGMAKVSLPANFWTKDGIHKDETARGPGWQAGTSLGDMTVEQPIQQNLRGLAGIYEYTFTVRPSLTLAAFREKADAYRKAQVSIAWEPTAELTTERLTVLERLFWRRLGPTMPAAWYGADMEGTLFGDDPASGWSIANLDSLLHILSRVPGVTSPYLYAGMWASVFCAHTEDMNLLSINYLHAGAPKIWYAVAPGVDAERFHALAEFQYSNASKECKEFLRHKRCLLSPRVLQKAGIRYTTTVQMPGEAVITFPGGYHFGFNTGFNVAEATNFGVPEWLSYGRKAQVCLCRPDSVRIDIRRLTTLLQHYNADKKKDDSLSWKKWSRQRDEKESRRKESQRNSDGMGRSMISPSSNALPGSITSYCNSPQKKKTNAQLTEQQRKNEFWVEVMRAFPSKGKAVSPSPATGKGSKKKRKKVAEKKDADKDVWHLARPIGRRRLERHARVLCIVPATAMGSKANKTKKGTKRADVDDEQCFAGQVVEISEDYARIHLDRTQKTSDIWMHSKGAKLFLDGGQWSEEKDDETSAMPGRQYWKEVDSKRLCVED